MWRRCCMFELCDLLTFHAVSFSLFFFFNDTATTEIYTLSLHDALPIFCLFCCDRGVVACAVCAIGSAPVLDENLGIRSEEHTSELQSRQYLVCRLLLEKKKKKIKRVTEQKTKQKKQSNY